MNNCSNVNISEKLGAEYSHPLIRINNTHFITGGGITILGPGGFTDLSQINEIQIGTFTVIENIITTNPSLYPSS